jgi:hypothetical protein
MTIASLAPVMSFPISCSPVEFVYAGIPQIDFACALPNRFCTALHAVCRHIVAIELILSVPDNTFPPNEEPVAPHSDADN